MIRKALTSLLAMAMLVSLVGCTIYSTQEYGTGSARVKKGDSLASALSKLGAPDIVYQNGKTQALVYKQRSGKVIVGIVYTVASRHDTVVVVSGGKVVSVGTVNKGDGLTILGLNDTAPISIDGGGGLMGGGGTGGSLMKGPDNYGYDD